MSKGIAYVADGRVVIDSRTLSIKLGRKHKHVLESIRSVIKRGFKGYFLETTYITSKGKVNPMYILDMEAFLSLAVAMRGTVADKVKQQIVEAFSKMSQTLNSFNGRKTRPTTNSIGSDTVPIKIVDGKEILDISPRERIKFFVTLLEQKKLDDYQMNTKRSTLYLNIYKTLLLQYGFSVFKEKEVLKARKRAEGMTEKQIEKVTYLDVIDAHPEIWSFVHQIITQMCEQADISIEP